MEPDFITFMDVMAGVHLRRIRNPAERAIPSNNWTQRIRPDWRWDLAHFLVLHRGGRRIRSDDDAVLLACDILRQRLKDEPPPWAYRPLIDAILIYERNQHDRWLLESHLLLPEVPLRLAAKLGLEQDTIDHYAMWFFDVRPHLAMPSSWTLRYALGGVSCNGFADDDLGPIWRRVAYSGDERMLDIAVAVTTGVGRQRFTDRECDAVQFQIEMLRLSPLRAPDRVLQIDRRLQAERNGEHPSVYLRPRPKPAAPVTPPKVLITTAASGSASERIGDDALS